MSLKEIIFGGGGMIALLTLFQLTPVSFNPWTLIGKAIKAAVRAIGRTVNADVLKKLTTMETELSEVKKDLDGHIKMDDERNADMHRARILQFNTELLRNIKHTEEDFNEIMYNIDCYERYCREHPDYQNNRAVHAIANISRVYDERMDKHDFL